jgi:sarcosine oxidase subunit gamma
VGEVTFTEIQLPGAGVWSIAPLKGARLTGLPEVGKTKTTKTSRTLWIGREQYLQIGGKKPINGAVTDQSDAWAMVSIEGSEALDVLARLCPVDLRSLASGDTVRSLINHMTAIITATDKGVEVLVFRAFAQTLVHELKEAAEMVAARKGLRD